jgi:GAF domain-containing protein
VGASTVDEVLHAFVEHLTTDAVDCCVLMMRDVRPALGIEQIRVAAIWNSMVDSSHLVGRRWAREAMPVLWQTTDSVRAIVDYREESGLDSESRQMLRDVFDLQSVLVIPLLTGEVLGWLLVGSISDRYSFTEREIRLYRGLADQAATVVQNFELLDLATDQAERERLVSVLGARIRSSTDVETILRTSIREVSRVLEASEAVISLHHPERNGHTSEEDGAQAADRDNGSGM